MAFIIGAALVMGWLGWKLNQGARRYARTDWGAAWMNWLDGVNRWFCVAYHRMPNVRLDLPAEGPAVVVSNHISGLDPMLLIAAADRPLRFMIAREEYERFGLQWLFRAVGCIPVDRMGRPERALREAFAALRRGEVVAIFPQGGIHLPDDPPKALKGGAARLARGEQCPLIPVRISGVAAPGAVISAVFRRGHAMLEPQPPIHTAELDDNALLDRVAQAIGHPRPVQS